MAEPDPVTGGTRDPYRLALLNGGAAAPTHEMIRAFEGEAGGSGPRFEAATFASLEDLLAHLDASAERGARIDVILIGPGPRERFQAARSLRERDGRVQIIFLAPASELLRIRRAVLFNPLLADMWSADLEGEAEALRTLARDAAEATRRRRSLQSTLERINLQVEAAEGSSAGTRQAPAASDRYLASLLRHAPDIIVSTDLEGRIVSWNDAARRSFGHSFDDAVGMPLWRLFARRPTRNARPLLRAVRAGEAVQQRQVVCQRADGSEFQGEVTVAPVRDDAGNRIGLSLIARDVSDRVRQQRELEQATERLEMLVEELRVRSAEAEAASRAKSEFLAALSHELRTPLQAVIGYASLIDEGVTGPVSEAQREQLQRIRGSSDHLLALIDQLLDLSRSDAEALRAAREPFDLCATVEEAVHAVRSDAEAKGLEISAPDCRDPGLRRMIGDPMRVRQILYNLLSNAVKFTDEGGIAVDLEPSGTRDAPEARVHVRDTGIGLEPEELDRVFDLFFQVQSGFSRRASGLGLGLSISRRLAEAMGGRLEVRSVPGEGSEFTLALPVEPG